jgi:hypothetical protein
MPVGGSVAVTVRVRDAGGNVIPNVPVTLSATGSGNQINPASDNTDVDGIATFTFSSSVAESKTLSATAGGVALNDTKTVTVFRRSATIRITGDSPDPSAPNETIHVTFEVTGEGGGTPTGTVAVFSLEEAGVGCPAAPIDANGQGFCDFAFTTEGGKRIEATYPGDSQFEDAAAVGVDHSVQTPAPTNQAPTSAFAAPTGCTAGTACPFDGTASSDPEGSLATWAWDFGDPFSFDDTGSGSTASHTYFVGGNATYTVTLTVTDTQGASNSVSHDVTIQ